MKKWTQEMERYLKANYKNISDSRIAQKLNLKYGTNFSISAIKAKREKLGLKIGYKRPLKYDDEVIEFILKNYKGNDNLELAKLLNETFNLNTNGDKVSMFKANYKRRYGIDLRTGINKGCFKKGHIPINKGTKGIFNVGGNKTSFKKGNVPANHRKLFEERITKDGYVEIKIKDGNLNRNWMPKHRYIYEQNYGPIPSGHKIIFADGNRSNFDKDNLILVSSSEEFIMNKRKLRYADKDLTNTGHLIAKLIDKTNKVNKNANK